VKISVQTNFPQVRRALSQLRTDVGNTAMASALNKTVAQAKTAMIREIRAEFNISAGNVGKRLKSTRAVARGSRFRLSARLDSEDKRGRSANLALFSARQTAKGVSFRVKKSGKRKKILGSFLINGGKTVMIRVGKQRLPIKALQTIDVAQMFNTKRINAKVLRFIEDKFPALFANEAKFFIERFKAGK
jgi:hypothetical protein